MYIRANGMILTQSDTQEERYWYKTMWYELHQEEGILLSAIGDIVKIKSQGDNLIDVLEEKDLVIFNNSVQIVKYRNGEGLVVLDYYSVDDTAEIDELREEHLKHYKIITHEQYMKLAQETK